MTKLNQPSGFADFRDLASQQATGRSTFDEFVNGINRRGASTAERALADALGSTIGGYRKATDRMHDVFGQSIADELARINGPSTAREAQEYLSGLAKEVHRPIEPSRLPDLPPNPIHKTNTHLKNVAATMAELLIVQARQAEKVDALLDVQAKQADLIDALLKAFVTNAATQDRAGKRNLTVAIVSAIFALGAIIAAFV